jgi:hypothetical protein
MKIGWRARTTDPSVASFRFRVQRPMLALNALGHQVGIFDLATAEAYDCVVFSKSYSEADIELARALRRQGKNVVLDICDNHLYNPAGLAEYEAAADRIHRMADACTQVICSTAMLAEVFASELGVNAKVVGDYVDDFGDRVARDPAGRPRLVWFGSHGSPNAPSGMTDLLRIADVLAAAYDKHLFELVVVSNSRQKFDETIAPLPIAHRYVEWSEESLARELVGASAVLLPLSDNPFVSCKTHNRLTLPLSAGVPVVGDVIDSYKEFRPYAFLDGWEEGLEAALAGDAAPGGVSVRGGRGYLDAFWNPATVTAQWQAALGVPWPAAVVAGEGLCGGLEFNASGHLVGWASDARTPQTPLSVEVMVNGRPAGLCAADLPSLSADSARAMRGSGRKFGVAFTRQRIAQAYDGGPLKATLRLAGSRTPVPGAALGVRSDSHHLALARGAMDTPVAMAAESTS